MVDDFNNKEIAIYIEILSPQSEWLVAKEVSLTTIKGRYWDSHL